MFDVTTARQIDYTDPDGQQLQVTVFQDRTDKGLWYLVPVPRLRIDQGQPTFSLTKYTSNGSGIAGACVFEVELFSPEDAKRAAERQIPGITGWGQFTWTSGTSFFEFDLPGKGGQQLAIAPSLFGSNTAHFQVELQSEDQVKAFIGAFSGEGKLSSFSISYNMGVLTQLLGAKATISYKASAAIEYERKYDTRKDTWGKSYSVLVEVKQNLKQSGAGEVKVEKGAGGTDELVQLVRDWAWSTLETQVADAVETARLLAQGNNDNPVSATSDFSASYSEDAIIEWSTPVSRFLPRFDAQTWSKVYHEVDNRQLMVTFELVGDPTDENGRPQFEDIEVTVRYPTRTTDNTFKLGLTKGAPTSLTYTAPGGRSFDPNYEYMYRVNFGGGQPPYTSGWIKESATRISFRPNQFGIRNVSFIGSGIPFEIGIKNTVKKVFIDFFETPPEGEKPKLQTKEMTANGDPIVFSSTYHVPVTNTYNYRLRYQMASGNVITVQPMEQFGSDNADQIFVLTPQEQLASFSLRAIATLKGDGFLSIDANAAYFDKQNPSLPPPPTHSWDGWMPSPQPGLSSSEPWIFMARPDPQTAYFELNGQVIYGDGQVFTLSDINVPYSRGPLILKDTEEVYSVEVFTDKIDWDQVDLVTLNVFQLRNESGALLDAAASIPAHRFVAITARQGGRADVLAAATRNLLPYNVLPPAQRATIKSLPLFYTLNRLRTSGSIVFYYNADYVLKDGSVRGTGTIEVTDKLQIHLPPVATKPPGVIQVCTVEMPVSTEDEPVT
jgi:hypothetical protein